MTWHSCTVCTEEMDALLARIREASGTVTSCRRCAEGLCVTWTTK